MALLLLFGAVPEVLLPLLSDLGPHAGMSLLQDLLLALQAHTLRDTDSCRTLDFWSVGQVLEEIVVVADLIDIGVGALLHDWLDIVLSEHEMAGLHLLEDHQLELTFGWRNKHSIGKV